MLNIALTSPVYMLNFLFFQNFCLDLGFFSGAWVLFMNLKTWVNKFCRFFKKATLTPLFFPFLIVIMRVSAYSFLLSMAITEIARDFLLSYLSSWQPIAALMRNNTVVNQNLSGLRKVSFFSFSHLMEIYYGLFLSLIVHRLRTPNEGIN